MTNVLEGKEEGFGIRKRRKVLVSGKGARFWYQEKEQGFGIRKRSKDGGLTCLGNAKLASPCNAMQCNAGVEMTSSQSCQYSWCQKRFKVSQISNTMSYR